MQKKQWIMMFGVLLVILIAYSGVAVAAPKYNESPIFAEKVAAGELPPVEERLPENPLVVTPNAEIG
jgi:peptide/nickel transport system substrate-binding protein